MTETSETRFNRRFLAYFAVFMSVCAMAYIGAITFITVPTTNVRFADTILGFVMGSVLGTILTFFYGSSKSSQIKDQATKNPSPVKVDDSIPIKTEDVSK